MDSTARWCSLFTRPFSMRASFSLARLRRIWASWMSRSARSASWVAMMPCAFREVARSAFLFACSKLFFAISTSRRASVSSRGVGSGRISKSGSPAETRSPTSRKLRRTMPEILLFTVISCLGRMAPTARAFSTTGPRVTATVLKPASLPEMDLL